LRVPPPVTGGDAPRPLTGSTNIARNTMVNPVEEQKRQDRLESWYEQDGRNEKSHSLHCLYTGLASKYMNKSDKND